jgi:hypothetical protein
MINGIHAHWLGGSGFKKGGVPKFLKKTLLCSFKKTVAVRIIGEKEKMSQCCMLVTVGCYAAPPEPPCPSVYGARAALPYAQAVPTNE